MESSDYTQAKEHIEKLIKELNLEEARFTLEKIIPKYPDNSELYDLYGEVLISLNQIKEAKKAIEKSISLAPTSNADKYMSLGQLLDKPNKKLQMYTKGVEVLRMQIAEATEIETKKELNLNLSTALCTIAELYMTTELCDTQNAEEICEQCLKEAYSISDTNIDVLVQYSNIRIIRKRDKEALEYMNKAMTLIMQNNNPDLFPDSDTIFNLAKNFSELEDYYNAIKLYDIVLQLDDQNLEYWYYAAFNHYKLKNYVNCLNCLENLRDVQKKTQEKDEELLLGVTELENELQIIASKGELTNNPLSNMDEDEEFEEEEHRNNSMNLDG